MRSWIGNWFFSVAFLAAAPAQSCNIALALAVDVSGSVDAGEYRLQIGGLASALGDPVVADALVAERAAVMLVQWSGRNRQEISVPWFRVSSRKDVAALSRAVTNATRPWRNYSTGIGEALAFIATEFSRVPDCKRKVVDVSGDGFSNEGLTPENLRATLVSQGIVVNGLAIESDEDGLSAYYRDKVIAGSGAFVLTANTFADYPARIRQKLLHEVTKKIALADR